MLETKFGDLPDFNVCAVIPPGANSFGYPLVPPDTKASFRVREFYYGRASEVILQKTGPESPTAVPSR